jgi:hypothetical protein
MVRGYSQLFRAFFRVFFSALLITVISTVLITDVTNTAVVHKALQSRLWAGAESWAHQASR